MADHVKYAIQDDYPADFAHCYGCGRLNQEGHHFRTGWDADKTVTIYKPKPEHTAIPGFVYGGLMASLIDCHGTGSAALALHRKNGYEPGSHQEPPRFVTASLNVDFIRPTPQDVTLKAIGTPEEIHPKKFRIHTDVYAGGTVCARASVTAAVMPDTFSQQAKK